MGILYLASSVLSLFFIAILAGKKNKSLSDRLLLTWFLVLFSSVFFFYMIYKESSFPWMVELLNQSVFLHGPLLCLYTMALTGKLERVGVRHLIHLIPFVLFFTWSTWLEYSGGAFLIPLSNILIAVKFAHPLAYILFSMRLVRQHRMTIRHLYSTTHHLELKWLSCIFWGGIVLMFIGIVTLLIHYLTRLDIPQYGGLYLNMAYSISIIVLGYYGFRQTAIFIPGDRESGTGLPMQEEKGNTKVKYMKSRLDDEVSGSLYRQLQEHMDSEKPFTDPDLTLGKLAGQLGTTGNKLSQVINSRTDRNFFEFVNEYRVNTVIGKMNPSNLRHITLLGLALDCGFNSKASFNRAFKKFTGKTPTEYLKKMMQAP